MTEQLNRTELNITDEDFSSCCCFVFFFNLLFKNIYVRNMLNINVPLINLLAFERFHYPK